MDYSEDKELAGLLHSKSYSLDVQVETNNKWHFSGVDIGIGTANIFVRKIDSEIGWILPKLVDRPKICGASNTLER